MSQSNQQTKSLNQVITDLVIESQRRPLVPFLGSGISYASGYPTIRGVNEYLAKVDFAIHQDVYSHRYPGDKHSNLYKEHPSFFIEDFGWPTIGRLNIDLWNWLNSTGKQKVLQSQPELMDDLGEAEDSLDFRDHQKAIVQWSLRRVLAEIESGTLASQQEQWKLWKKAYHGEQVGQVPDLLFGDWEEMLDRLCEGNLDLVDSLFTSFEQDRKPTVAHRYLAFLIEKLSIPLIFTTNFDSFLETALTQEGVAHRSFDIHRDAMLPHKSLGNSPFCER